MQDHSSLELRMDRLNTFTSEELDFIISHTKGTLTLEVPCPSIGSTQSYQDVAFDLLNALFIGETITQFSEDVSFYQDWDKVQNCQIINFVLTPQNPTELARQLHWLSPLFRGDEEEDIFELPEELEKAVSNFQDQIGLFEKEKYHFPSLVDDYFSNYIIGLGEDHYAPDDISELLEMDQDDPIPLQIYLFNEHGYVQSMHQENYIANLYYSTTDSTWIILSNLPIDLSILEHLLDTYRDHVFKPLELQEATALATATFDSIAFNHVEAVKYPFEKIAKAQECAMEINRIKNGKSIDKMKATKVKQNLLSIYGDILIVVDQTAQYIFFSDSLPKISTETLRKMVKGSPPLKVYLDNLQENLNKRTLKHGVKNKPTEQEH